MVRTRKQIIKYWASEPSIHEDRPHHILGSDDCFFDLGPIPFPDPATLSEKEREILRPVLEQHPEYLLEIFLFQTERIQ